MKTWKWLATIVWMLLLVGCATREVSQETPTQSPDPAHIDPSTEPISNGDLLERDVKQKESSVTIIIVPTYQNEDYVSCAALVRDVLSSDLAKFPWFTSSDLQSVIPGLNGQAINALFHDEPQLMTQCHDHGVDCVIAVEVKGIQFASEGQKVQIENPSSRQESESFSRQASVTLRVKALNTFEMVTAWEDQIIGESTASDVTLDTKGKVLASACTNALQRIREEVASRFKPKPTVTEVRGSGRYLKINAGTSSGFRNGTVLWVFKFLAIKDPTGHVISIEARKITSVPVIEAEADQCWCDASLSQGMIMKGDIVIPAKNE